jgi:ATP/maltotriose-dependent transcriptional regulator MalT
MADELDAETRRFYDLAALAKAAFGRGELDSAEALADELLTLAIGREQDWNYGNAIHHGHLVRGQVALSRGDVEAARAELLLGGKTRGSPQLDTFGPNMALAAALIAVGETAVALEYFELVRVFWDHHRGRLDGWAEDVNAGRTPRFGPNMVYGRG